MRIKEIETPTGLARAHVERPPHARGTVIVSHGAGGGIEAPDLVALRELTREGWAYVRVEQPWRVAGKKVAPAPAVLDKAWVPIVSTLMTGRGKLPRPLVAGGRSAGARAACRTAGETGAAVVLAISFPVHPAGTQEPKRAPEAIGVLDAGVPLLIVQGERDPFGTAEQLRSALGSRVLLHTVSGDHSLRTSGPDVRQIVRTELDRLLPRGE